MNRPPFARFPAQFVAILWAAAGISCADETDPGLMKKVQAVAVKQMGVFTTTGGNTCVALVVEVSNASPHRIVIEEAALAVGLKREELEGILAKVEVPFGDAIVLDSQTIAPSGAAKATNSFLRLVVPLGDPAGGGTLEALSELFNLLAADRWHEDAAAREQLAKKRVHLNLSGPVKVRVGDDSASEVSERQISLELELTPSVEPVFVSKP